MKKLFVTLALCALFPAGVFASYVPGVYTAKQNLNIRSLPSMSGLLIDHFNQGASVNVLKVIGSWCSVATKYVNSYVYCSYLAPAGATGVGTLTVTNVPLNTVITSGGLVSKNLQETQNWLLNGLDKGADYINNSYFTARDDAATWDGEPRIADFYFQWPLTADSKCLMTFTGAYHAHEVFKAACFDNAGLITTSKAEVTNPQQAYDLPHLPFKTFVSDLLADKTLMTDFDAYFAKTLKIKGLFRLYMTATGIQVWEGKFIDEASGRFMVVTADASKTTSTFQVQKGVF